MQANNEKSNNSKDGTTCKLSFLLCKCGWHDMQYVACWCEPASSIIIQEYECSRCGKTAWNFAYFNADACKVLTRVPVGKVDFENINSEEDATACCDNGYANCTAEKDSGVKKTARPRKAGSRKQQVCGTEETTV